MPHKDRHVLLSVFIAANIFQLVKDPFNPLTSILLALNNILV